MLGQCRREVLANGLRVVGAENPALHSFVCSVYARVGMRFEPPDKIGLSHFLEHMILQGSSSFPTSNAVMRSVEDLGGIIDAVTHAEYINVVFGVHRKHWVRAMDIAADVLLHPLFEEAEFEQERQIILQEISRFRDPAGRNISSAELAYCALFRGHVDEAGTRGTGAMMAGFDRDMVFEHYADAFRPDNMVMCLAGGFDFDEVLAHVEDHFGLMPPAEGPLPFSAAPVPVRDGRRALYRTTEALPVTEVAICHPAPGMADPQFDALRAVSHLLGGGLSSRLFARVREELGLVYDIASQTESYADAGALDVVLSVGVENLVDAVQACLEEVARAASGGFTPEELERHKEGARCGAEMLCDIPGQLANWYGRQEVLLGPDRVVSPQGYVRRQEALTLEDLRLVGADVLCENGAVLVAVGPYGDDEREALKGLFPAREVSVAPDPRKAADGR